MSSYLVDVICALTPFPLLSWNWSPAEEPIHLYCSKMWAINCKNHFYDICNFFMVPLHLLLKNLPAPRFNQDTMNAIKEIGDWFINEEFSYIRIFGCEGPPHLFPGYVPDMLALKEIAYHIVVVDIAVTLAKNLKKQWPNFPISLGIYTLSNPKHAQKEIESLDRIWLAHGDFKRHDPIEVVIKHYAMVKRKTYIHEHNPFDIVFQGVMHFHEVRQRIYAIRDSANFFHFIE
jgi:hypothetical protein